MNSDIPGKPAEDLPGPILLDGLLQSFLLGTIVNQAFKYWMDYRDDSCRKRVFVIGVIMLSILQTILEDYKVWRTLILHRRWSTSRIEWSDLFLNGCICWLCEGFYIKRCWKMMDRTFWVLVPLSVLSIFIMAANLYLAIAMGIAFRSLEGTNDTLTTSHFLLPSTIVAFSFWIFGSLGKFYYALPAKMKNKLNGQHVPSVLETTVTAILMISLWRSRTGFSEVDKTVVTIIHLTWESAILPSICMLIAVGIYHAAPRLDDHLVLFFVLLTGKFYTFGMLRTLNSRSKLRRRMQSHDFGRTSLSTWQQSTSATAKKRKQSSLTTLALTPSSSKALKTDTSERSIESSAAPSVEDFNNNLPFATSVQINTPSMDAQERGTFRNRVCSTEHDPSLDGHQESKITDT